MKDETYSFISDVKEKGTVARSSHNRRSHTGRGGKVRFPSDNLSKKELKQMSGECKSFRLNEPMTWAEFKSMPDDIKVTYIRLLQEKWNVPIVHIGKMMGVSQPVIQRETARLGIVLGKGVHKQIWDKDAFYAWANGVSTPVPEEAVQEKRRLSFWVGLRIFLKKGCILNLNLSSRKKHRKPSWKMTFLSKILRKRMWTILGSFSHLPLWLPPQVSIMSFPRPLVPTPEAFPSNVRQAWH